MWETWIMMKDLTHLPNAPSIDTPTGLQGEAESL